MPTPENTKKTKQPDWVRVVMQRETRAWIDGLEPDTLDAFEISGHEWGRRPFKTYSNAFYPDFDICAGAPDGKFDLIIAEQVWEHLRYPHRAAQNVLSALRPGGYFLITVPCLIRVHPTPDDCSRWTAQGLRYFLEEAGFDPAAIRTDQWGNKQCVIENLEKWPRYNAQEHSLENDPLYPVVAWALARRPVN
ncbi:methyltransferase domain-containing protein [Pseudahrensia aquimaris]|uniref:Methyltransferase domain-containing protein n=1 Tax=Pseudahrensia aquimaris TaxID=744461 RepID=A0ABW3FIX4_9HYPH